jgi:integrase
MRVEPRLWRRYNGVYYAVLPGDQRVSLKSRDKDEAKKLFHDFCRKWMTGKLAALEGARNVKLGAFRTEYLKSRKSRADSTLRNDKAVLDHLVASYGVNRTLRSLTVRDLERFKAGLLKGVTATTVNGYLRHLRGAFATALRWEYLLRNPATAVPFELEPQREAPPVIEEVLTGILSKSTAAESRAFRILLYTGLRPFELCKLTYGHIVGGVIRVKGKRGRIRVIPVMGECKQLLGEGVPTAHVIPWRHPVTLSHKFRVVATAAGYGNVRLYDLRHTFGTVMVLAGVDPFHVSKLMGHTSLSTTQRYVTVTRKTLELAVGKADGMFGGTGKKGPP